MLMYMHRTLFWSPETGLPKSAHVHTVKCKMHESVRCQQVQHTKDTMPGSNAEMLVICIGVSSGVSRLISGKVADLPGVNRIRMQQFAFFLLGVSTACIPLAPNFSALVGIVLVLGISDGCLV